jgi:hypothetical protein
MQYWYRLQVIIVQHKAFADHIDLRPETLAEG